MSIGKGYADKTAVGNPQHVNVQPTGSGRNALDTANRGVFPEASDVVEAGATTTTIPATGHVAKAGDMIRFTSGALEHVEMAVLSVTANLITMAGTFSEAPGTGDTFQIMRWVTPSYDEDGSLSVSLSPPAGGFATATKQDEQSVLLGAVTETAPASDTASSGLNGRLQRVAQRITSLIALLPASLGQKAMTASFPVVISSDQSPIPVSGDTGLKGYGDSTQVSTRNEATVQSLNGQRFGMDVVNRGFAFITTGVVDAGSTTTVLNSASHVVKPGDCLRFLDFTSLRLYEVHVQSVTTGTITLAGTLPFTPTPTETFAINRPISPQYDQTGKQYVVLDTPNGGFATADRQGNVNETAPTTDTASSGQNGRLQRIAQRLTSLMTFTPVGMATLDFAGTPVTSAAYVELVASAAETKKVQIFMSQGNPLFLAFGAAASEVDKIYVIPGGNGLIDLTIPAGTRVSLKAVSTTANTGYILVNFLG